MRLSKEELLLSYPSWNNDNKDIVKVMYGDIPQSSWNSEEYKQFQQLEGTLSNIFAVDAYMWRCYGDYDIFHTLIGEVRIAADGQVLCGYMTTGQYTVNLMLMHGKKSLDVLKILSSGIRGFSNKDGCGPPSLKISTSELDTERVEEVLTAADVSDYGESVKLF